MRLFPPPQEENGKCEAFRAGEPGRRKTFSKLFCAPLRLCVCFGFFLRKDENARKFFLTAPGFSPLS